MKCRRLSCWLLWVWFQLWCCCQLDLKTGYLTAPETEKGKTARHGSGDINFFMCPQVKKMWTIEITIVLAYKSSLLFSLKHSSLAVLSCQRHYINLFLRNHKAVYIIYHKKLHVLSCFSLQAELVNPRKRPSSSWPDKGEVTFTDYQTRYRKGLDLVLKGVNCHIKGGEKVWFTCGSLWLTLSFHYFFSSSWSFHLACNVTFHSWCEITVFRRMDEN